MTTEYRNICDACGKETRAFDDSRKLEDEKYIELAVQVVKIGMWLCACP